MSISEMLLIKGLLCVIVSIFLKQINGFSLDEETRNSTKFSLDFYEKYFDTTSNSVVSPLSFRILLSLVYQSAEGQTEFDIRNKLYFAADKRDTFQSQQLSLNSIRSSPCIKVLNKIYLKISGELNDDFRKAVEEYGSTVEQVNFSHKAEVVELVNNWAKENTNGLIKDLLNEKLITDDTALLLMNTLYFKAKWLRPFSSKSVHDDTFHGIDGVDGNTKFMRDTDSFDVASPSNLKSQVIQLNYETNSGFKFWVILPDAEVHLSTVVGKLSSDVIREISTSFVSQSISFSMPIFEVEAQCNGKKILKELGLSSLFELNDLDMLNGDKIKVTDAGQKTKIIVNTDGTEAATSTYIKGVSRSYRPTIKVNRPFMFMILTKTSNEPIFIGHYVKVN